MMHIIALFFPIFLNFQKQWWQKAYKEEGDVDMEVEVDEVDDKQ